MNTYTMEGFLNLAQDLLISEFTTYYFAAYIFIGMVQLILGVDVDTNDKLRSKFLGSMVLLHFLNFTYTLNTWIPGLANFEPIEVQIVIIVSFLALLIPIRLFLLSTAGPLSLAYSNQIAKNAEDYFRIKFSVPGQTDSHIEQAMKLAIPKIKEWSKSYKGQKNRSIYFHWIAVIYACGAVGYFTLFTNPWLIIAVFPLLAYFGQSKSKETINQLAERAAIVPGDLDIIITKVRNN